MPHSSMTRGRNEGRAISAPGEARPAGWRPIWLMLLCAALLAQCRAHDQHCQQVSFGKDDIACQCNASYCDSLQFEWPLDDADFVRVFSSKSGARFQVDRLRPEETHESPHYVVGVESNLRKQQVTGFGGAFTDSASQMIALLPEQVRRRALDDYFGPHGLDYNLGRVPIAGTDMSTRAYSYDDLPEDTNQTDFELKHFKLQREDLLFKIPLIKRVDRMRAARQLEPLKLMAASWSAPAWMKTNNNLVQGRIKGDPSGPYYMAYARYVIRFLEEYERNNVTIWALTPQNEPHTPTRTGPSTINFNSVNFSPDQMGTYLRDCLVPSLQAANRTRDNLKLFIWDDTLKNLHDFQRASLAASNVRDFACGLSLHWYSTGDSFASLFEARQRLPARYAMISTEASFIGKPHPGSWYRGARYALDILMNLRAGSIGWIDWNLALNMSGGPTWVNNILDAAMLVDPANEVYLKNPMFYALGHVSRFIRPNSHVLKSWVAPGDQPQNERWLQEGLVAVTAELEEPQLVAPGETRRKFAMVLLNRSPDTKRVLLLLKNCPAKNSRPPLQLELEGHSITSLAYLC